MQTKFTLEWELNRTIAVIIRLNAITKNHHIFPNKVVDRAASHMLALRYCMYMCSDSNPSILSLSHAIDQAKNFLSAL